MGDEHYIEVTALIGPIDPPHKLHTFDDDGVRDTVHGARAQRIFEAILGVDPDANLSAHVVDEDSMPDDGEGVAAVVANRDWLRARVGELELQAGDRERHLRDALKDVTANRDRLRAMWEEQRAIVKRLHESTLGQLTDERDRLRAVVDAQRDAIHARNCYISADTDEERDAAGRMMEVARERLLALDVSPAMGGEPVFTEDGLPVPEPYASDVRRIHRQLHSETPAMGGDSDD